MNSIRIRLLLALLAMLALAALAMGGLAYRSVAAQAEALFDYQLKQMALSLRDQGEIAPAQVRSFADEQLDFVIQIWTVDGRSIYASREHPDLPARALLGLADINVGGRTWRTFGVATRERVIQVAQPLQIRKRLAADAALRSVAPLAFIAPPLALGVWWLAALTLAPLRRVAADMRRRDGRSLEPLAADGLPDEVAPLVAALNLLLERLARSLDAQRGFVADAAHELRSPLTALKLQLELLRRAPDAAARTEATDRLAEGIERSARLVEQLLALARSEPGAAAAALQPLDLVAVVRQAVADTVPLATARGSTLEFVADAAVPLQGDAAALAVLARNLVDNALRHSPPGGRVEVRVGLDGLGRLGGLGTPGALGGDGGGVPTCRVDDAGPGIPAAERERVFDRFYRRADADATGSGLGLAIVRSIADRHGARVELGDSPLGGLRVTVQFPRRPAATAA